MSARLALPMLALLLLSATARAVTITVTRFDDTAANSLNAGDGLGVGVSGDLRSAILAANAAGGTNIIGFSCASAPCTITLNGPLPPIFATATTPGGIAGYNLTIDGGQFGTVIIDGGGKYRVFFVDNVAVTIENLQIQNANATGGPGGLGAGGGGAGFGAGLFVNQATAVVTLSNIYFSNCSVTGGNGGAGVAGNFLSGGGGGGGLGFGGGGDNNNSGVGGGGGVTGPGSMTNGGTGGGGGPGEGTGGSGYADNSAGGNGTANGLGGAGGFGGGGGGAAGEGYGNGGFGGGGSGADIGLVAGNGGFGGGGGGSNNGAAGTSPTVDGIGGGAGGAGSGWSGGEYGVTEIPDGGGGGGAAAGPAIFVNLGSVTLDNVSGAGFSATGGIGGSGETAGCCSATDGGNGGASSVPVFNYGGKVNGSTTVGPIANALPGGAAVPGTTPTSLNFASVPVGSSVAQPVFFTVASGTVVGSINVLTQGASGLDFTQAADTTCTATTYAAVTNCSVNVQFAPKHAGMRMGAVVFQNGSGAVLATAYIYGVGQSPVLAFPSNTTTISLGSGYSDPFGIAVDAAGDVFVADNGTNHAVKEIMAVGGSIPANPTVKTLSNSFTTPIGVAVDGAGNVYVADPDNNKVTELVAVGGSIPSNPVILTVASLTGPAGVAVDGAGNVYIVTSSAIEEVVAATGGTRTFGSGFDVPYGVAVDGAGNVYVADYMNHAVKEIVAVGGSIPASPTINTLSAAFSEPTGLAVDGAGNVYVADNSGVVKEILALDGVVPASPTILTLGAGFSHPAGVAVDGSGNVYVADTAYAVKEIPLGTPPNLSFANTDVGDQSSDSPGTIVLQNIGNATLTFPIPLTGTDPSVAANFSLDSSTTCPEVTTSSSAGVLAAGGTCNLAVDFIPTTGTSITGSVVLTDNNLNVAGATQSIGLSGTGTQPLVATSVVVTGYPSPVYAGVAHTGTVTVDDQNGNLLTTYSGSATITTSDTAANVTTPVTIANGTGTFTVTFSTTGTNQTITAAIPGPISGSQTGIVVNPFPDYVVTTATDDASGVATNCPAGGGGADCSLRDALAAAAAAGEGKITFSPSVFTAPTTINLGKGLTIPANTLVQGVTSGSGYTLTNLITLSGIEVDSITGGAFNVSSGVTGASIANLTIQNTNGEANIVNAGTLAVSGSTVTVTNNAYATRGIYNSGTMTLTDSTVSDNLTGPAGNGYGAGIYNSGSLTIVYSTISGNENASGNYAYGGGIYTTGTLRVESSTIANNLAFGAAAFGGGIDIGGGSATINNSIVTGNTGGNIYGSYGGSGNQSATLSALGNYGGPTKTMLPEPGSASICGGFQANIPNQVTLDQRGLPNTNSTYAPYNSSSPCVDTGAVQTNYSLIFSTEPQPISPASLIFPSTNFEAGVTLDESGAPFTAAAETIPLALSATTGSLTGGSASTSTTTGIATYSTLQVSATGTADSLTASLTLNPAAGTPPSVSAVSNSFTVSPPPVANSVVVTGYPSPVYAGVAHTGTVTVDDQYGNPLTTYSGSATITTSDTAATVTTPVTITNGTGTFTVTFATTGTQSITAAIQGLTSVAQTGIQVNATPGFVVTSTGDDATGVAANCPGTSCTLRDAITAADAAGTGNITFSPTVFKSTNTTAQNTITLPTPLPALSGLLTIQGLGASIVTVSGNNSATVSSIFTVHSGATISISGLTIANGNAGGLSGPLGGGIASYGNLTVADCVFSGNTASAAGGAIYSGDGSLVVQNSTFSSNSASVAGGGAIWAAGDSASVSYSTFYNNTTGGGLAGSGGAIISYRPLTVSDSTFSSNSSGDGGAIYASFSATTVVNSIFAGNSAADSRGAAIFSDEVFNASNNLYYQNFDRGTTTEDDCYACTSNTGAISGNPSLAPLGNYGGPTPTMIPLPGSAAICTASSALIPNGATTDQRGFPPSNTSYPAYTTNACIDLGAVQTNYSLIFSTEPQPISPATSIVAGTDFETAVTLDESSAPFIGPSVTIPMAFTGAGGLAGGSATTSTTTGIATYNGLTVSSADTGDTLTAYLVLNSAISTQPAISVKSSQFTVSPATVQVSVGTNIAGLSSTLDGSTSTATQTPTWSIPSQHTIATTSPQYLGGIEYTWSSWSDGGAISHQVAASASTTMYAASFQPNAYELTVTAGPGGTLSSATAAESGTYFADGSDPAITAIPNNGYYFVNWSGAGMPGILGSATSASTTVEIVEPESLTANFLPIPGYVVTSTADDASGNAGNCPGTGTSCTLRDAITAANAAGAGTITFSPTAFASTNTTAANTITLLTQLPALNGQITIQGLGANIITVSGNNSVAVGSIFQVPPTTTLAISGLTIANGNGVRDVNGGAINSAGALTVANCVFFGNTAVAAGAIYVGAGSFTVQNSTFSSNSATSGGGAAIYAAGTSANISYSTFYNNISGGAGGLGGAIVSYGPLTVSDSTFSSNSASLSYGGAIESIYPATVVNSIFSGNSAAVGAGINANGLTSSFNLFYQNYDTGTTNEDDCNGCTTASTITGINPNLAPLGNYGGPTPTMIPLPASPAICAASSALIPNGVTTDQRGDPDFTTYNSMKCYDLGAVQTNYAVSFNAANEPPPTGTVTNVAMTPAPVVTVTESTSPLTAGAVSLSVTDLNSALSPTTVAASTSATNGQATLSSLVFATPTTNDTLTATLALNPNITAINLTTISTQFGVTAQALSVTCSATTAGTVQVAFNPGAETVTGGSLPYTFSITGSLPAGLSFNTATGAVTGIPLAPGTFGIAVEDKLGTAGAGCPFTIVPQTAQTVTLSGLPSIATYGSAGPYTLSVSGGASGNPVTLSVTGPGTVKGLLLTITGAGNVTVTANQAGSGIYAPAAPVSITVIVNPIPQTITFTGLPPQIALGYGGPYTLTATGGGSNNPVTFSFTGPATLKGTLLTITGVGNVVVTANQAGNTNYAPAAPVSQTVNVVNQLTPVITWATPAPISATTALSGVQLNATANIPGTFSYLPCAGTVLTPGPQVVIATFTPANNLLSEYSIVTAQVTIQVNPAGSTPIVPYIELNGGAWQNVSSITVNPTDTVNLAPWPTSGGSWKWTGPNGFTSNARAIYSIALPSPTNIYTATYTNPSGVKSVQAFTIAVNSTPIVPYLQVNGGAWQNVSSVTANYTDIVNLAPLPASGGSWSWSGPNGFSSTMRAIYEIPLTWPVNVFTATYTNPDGVTSTQAFTITVNSTPIVPYLQVGYGAWQNVASATVPLGSTVNFGPWPTSGGSWSWTGPNGFSSNARAVYGITLTSPTNVYIATYTNPAGVTSTKAFTITIAPTSVVPYLEVNEGAWQNAASVTVPLGSSVNLGPWPTSGGSWSWTGPNGFTSSARAIYGVPLTSPTNVYIATYTNPDGVTSAQAFTITIAPTPVIPYLEVDGGAWQNVASVTANYSDTVNLAPWPTSGGSWNWTGPNGFTSTSRAIYGVPLTLPTNVYIATYTNPDGVTSTQTFTLTVASTPITPYIEVDNGAWLATNSMNVAPGSTVNLGPQPVSGGSWIWKGPNGFTSTSRGIYAIPLSSGTNTYTATYANPSGVTSTETFTITVY